MRSVLWPFLISINCLGRMVDRHLNCYLRKTIIMYVRSMVNEIKGISNFFPNYELLTQVLTDLSLTTTSGKAYVPSLAVF